MQATEEAVRQIVQQVLSQISTSPAAPTNGSSHNSWGVFNSVDEAVAAAQRGFEQL